MSAQAGQVLYILGALVLLQVTGRLDVGEDLIIVSGRKRLTSGSQQRHTLYSAKGKHTWCDACS